MSRQMGIETALSILRSDFAHVELAAGSLSEPVAVLFAAFIEQRCEVERLRGDVREWERQFAGLGVAAGRGEPLDTAAAGATS